MKRKMTYSVAGTLLLVSAFVPVFIFYTKFEGQAIEKPKSNTVLKKEEKKQEPNYVKQPEHVKGVYVSQCGATSKKIREHIENLLEKTEINSVVIDVKDYTGTISFETDNPVILKGGKGCKIKDLKKWIEKLHNRGVYVIARITVFQDPLYAQTFPEEAVHKKSATTTPWKDHKGLSFIDVGSRKFWKYIVEIAKEAHAIGFDELNFDYIRYPSDGPMNDVYYSRSGVDGVVADKSAELEKFFRYLSRELRWLDTKHKPVLSADLFGMTTTNYDDLWIGQIQERAESYFDILSPMVYPSHYPRGFLGMDNPNKNVYRVIFYSMTKSAERLKATTTPVFSFAFKEKTEDGLYKKPAKDPKKVLRPWLQDFDYGGIYDAKAVRDQIQAVYDAGLSSWLLWNPANIYTIEALKPNPGE